MAILAGSVKGSTLPLLKVKHVLMEVELFPLLSICVTLSFSLNNYMHLAAINTQVLMTQLLFLTWLKNYLNLLKVSTYTQ